MLLHQCLCVFAPRFIVVLDCPYLHIMAIKIKSLHDHGFAAIGIHAYVIYHMWCLMLREQIIQAHCLYFDHFTSTVGFMINVSNHTRPAGLVGSLELDPTPSAVAHASQIYQALPGGSQLTVVSWVWFAQYALPAMMPFQQQGITGTQAVHGTELYEKSLLFAFRGKQRE
jgi:hypothetical protein